MTFDFGGFLGGIIGTIGAFGVAFYTIRWQQNKEKPTIIGKRYQIVLNLSSLTRISRTEVAIYAGYDNNVNLSGTILKVMDYQYQIEKLLPETIEVDKALHTIIKKIANDVVLLNDRYLDTSADSKPVMDKNIIQKYVEEFYGICSICAGTCGKVIREIETEAGIQ